MLNLLKTCTPISVIKFYVNIWICKGWGLLYKVITFMCYMGLAAKGRCSNLSQMLQCWIFEAWTFYDQHGIFFHSSEQLKQRFSFLQLKYGDLYSVLDAAKVYMPWTSLFKIGFLITMKLLIRLSGTELVSLEISNFLDERVLIGVNLSVRLLILCCFFSLPHVQWIHLARSACHASLHKVYQHIFWDCRYMFVEHQL